MKPEDILELDAANIIGVCLDVKSPNGYVKYNYTTGETVADCITTIKRQVRIGEDPFPASMRGYSIIRELVELANERWDTSHRVLGYNSDSKEFFYAESIDSTTMIRIPDKVVDML